MIDLRVFAATLRLLEPVVAADGTHDVRTTLFVRVDVDGSIGWAECPVARVTGLDPTEHEVLVAFGELASPGGTTRVLHDRAGTAALGALETALLDARLRTEGRSLCAELGVVDDAVRFAGVVGIDEPAGAAARATGLVASGATRIRVKVSPTSGTAAVRAVLDAVDVPVVADANGSFDPASPSDLAELAGLPIAWLEQPFAPGHDDALQMLARSGAVLGADESVTSPEALAALARAGHVSVLCVKPSRFGVHLARHLLDQARSEGLSTYVGGFFEAGLGRAALGAISAGLADLDGDVVAPSTYLVDDPCRLAAPLEGSQPLYGGPGTGPLPDDGSLTLRLVTRVASEPRGSPP